MSEKLLNIVIIAKNNTSLRFRHTLKSLINQEYSPISITVADINEEDSDYSLGLQEDLTSYKDVCYIKLDSSLRTSEVRNFMLRRLKGKYVAFLNANDFWDKKAAWTIIREMEENQNINAVCMNGYLKDERKADISEEFLINKEAYDISKWVFYNPARMPAQLIYRIESLIKAGGFDEKLDVLCDADMVLRLSKSGGVIIKPELFCKCLLTESFTDYELKLFTELKKLRLKFLELYLRDRKLNLKFYEKMAELAGKNYMWLDFIMFRFLCFINSPLKSLFRAIKSVCRFIRFAFFLILRELSISNDRIFIRYKIRFESTEKIREKSVGKNGGTINLTFSSAGEFNSIKPLKYAFNNKIRSVKIPEHVTTIKKGMFYGCENLAFVEIPDSVTKIEAHAFHNCINLRNVKFGKNSRLTKIGNFAFAGCKSLKEINLPQVNEIGSFAFARCCSLVTMRFGESRYFPADIERIPRYAFAGCKNLISVEFENNSWLESIDNYAFYGCSSLKKAVVTGMLKKVGNYAFAFCIELESAAILNIDAVETIGKGAFMHCRKLAYFQFPVNLKRVRAKTFYGCLNLKSVKIPKKVLSINYKAFGDCTKLKYAVILSESAVISAKAFDKHTRVRIQESTGTKEFVYELAER